MAPSLFLAVSILGALFTLNAYMPQRRTGPLVIPSFLFGWLTSELPLHHIAWQVVATALFIWAGALESGAGWLGLGICLVSWAALANLVLLARQAKNIFEAGLSTGLGEKYRDAIAPDWRERIERATPPPGLTLNPFRMARRDVEVIRDIAYGTEGGKRNWLDIYQPAGGTSGAPVLLQIHGGGWTIGNKHEQALPLMYHLAAQGWICVAINYRLSPQATFPDHLVDCKRAIGWIRSEIEEYGGDPGFIAVTGGSAGGHLTAMVGLTANDPEYQPGFEEVDTQVQAAVPFYGIYDFSDHFGLHPTKSVVGMIGKTVLKRNPETQIDDFRRASPLHRIHAEAPPFLTIHGTSDGLAAIEEARTFAQKLQTTSKSAAAFVELPGTQHAFEVFHSLRTRASVLAVSRFLGWSLAQSK